MSASWGPVAVTAVVLAAPGLAADQSVCPATIDVQQQRLSKPIPGWTTMSEEASHALAGVTFFDGPPEEKASLVYDGLAKAGANEIATWRFDPKSDRQIWIACSYSGTTVVLKRALLPKPARCSVTYDSKTRVAGLPEIEKIACK